MSKKQTSPAVKFWRGVGFVFQGFALVLGGYGVVLALLNLDTLASKPGAIVETLTVAQGIAGWPVLPRFLMFILILATFTLPLVLVGLEYRRINRVLGGVMSAVNCWVFGGIVYLGTMISGIRWTADIHFIGNILFGLGFIILMFAVTGVGLRARKLRELWAIVFALLALPVELMFILLVFVFANKGGVYVNLADAAQWVMIVVSVGLLVGNGFIFYALAKDKSR